MEFSEASNNRVFICRLQHESDFLESVRRFVDENRIDAATFSAMGASKEVSFAFYDQEKKEYMKKKIKEPMEILSCIGNIAKLDGKTVVHAHIVVSDSEGRVFGGHLDGQTMLFACELFLTELKGVKLIREYDKTTGLNLFTFK